MKSRKTPYEVLGVDKSATPDQVKRAYRQKARKAHPDKGGDTTAMAEVNHAFDILGDSKRRLLYDSTGEEEPNLRSEEQEVRNILLQAFAQAIQEDAPDLLHRAIDVIIGGQRKIEVERTSAKAVESRFLRRRDKIQTKGDRENVFHMMVDSELTRIAGFLAQADRAIGFHQAAIAALKEYTSTEEVRIRDLMGGEPVGIFYIKAGS